MNYVAQAVTCGGGQVDTLAAALVEKLILLREGEWMLASLDEGGINRSAAAAALAASSSPVSAVCDRDDPRSPLSVQTSLRKYVAREFPHWSESRNESSMGGGRSPLNPTRPSPASSSRGGGTLTTT